MTNILLITNIVAAIGSLCGIMLLAHKRKSGFLIFFIVELCMIYIGYNTKQYGIVMMSIIYFFSNIYAYYLWNKDSSEENKSVNN